MKIISWNIRGCNHQRKLKTLGRKLRMEKPDVLYLQETKCSFETMMRIGPKVWKGNIVMAIDSAGMGGGIVILWDPSRIDLSEWRDSHFSLEATFKFLDSGASGTLVNIYGPSASPQKQEFIHHLRWLRNHAQEGTWIVGGYFNLITFVREKRGKEGFRQISRGV